MFGSLPRLAFCLALILSMPAAAFDHDPRNFDLLRLDNGLVVPYPLENIFRGYGRCKRGGHTHRALDIGGVGPDWGVGTPILAMARARVLTVGTPESDPKRYGQRDTADGSVKRGKVLLPRRIEVPGYGTVHPFTTNYGRLRTGVLVTTRVLEGRLKGFEIRYMHLAALHPSVVRGAVVEAGQELGLMGGTAVQTDPPHLHLAIFDRQGRPRDPARLLGIGSSYVPCSAGKAAQMAKRQELRRAARTLMRKLVKAKARTPRVASVNALPFDHPGAFVGSERAHRFWLPPSQERRVIRVDAAWRPRLKLLNAYEVLLHDGLRRRKAGRRFPVTVNVNGRKTETAEYVIEPTDKPFLLQVGAWRRAPKEARYRLRVTAAPAVSDEAAATPVH